jgi:hypothetical protein
MKLASNTESQALAVGWEMPQSEASDDKLSSCAVRPAQSWTSPMTRPASKSGSSGGGGFEPATNSAISAEKSSVPRQDDAKSDPKSLRPIVAIELDDKSHLTEKREKRDATVNTLCAAAGLRLVRVPGNVTVEELNGILNRITQRPQNGPFGPEISTLRRWAFFAKRRQ